ncbi:MAG: CarD family transcriptional regulator, partial [Bdellovibrionota bacterium]
MTPESLSLNFEKSLERAFELNGRGAKANDVEATGTDSTLALALVLSQAHSFEMTRPPQLVIVPTPKEAEELERHLAFFDPEIPVSILSGFDVSPFSGLYPNSRAISGRVRWAYQAQNPGLRHIFVAPVAALLQRTIPPDVLKRTTLRFNKGRDLPSELSRALGDLGYQSVPVVEDEGTFAIRGGIVDIFSPAHRWPVRVELFGDTVESIRLFNPETQRSEAQLDSFTVIPPREILYSDEARIRASARYRKNVEGRSIDETDRDVVLQSLVQGALFPGLDFMVADFYDRFALPIDHFEKDSVQAWIVNPIEVGREADALLETMKKEHEIATEQAIHPDVADLYSSYEKMSRDAIMRSIKLSKIEFSDRPHDEEKDSSAITYHVTELKFPPPASANPNETMDEMVRRVRAWKETDFAVFIAAGTQAQSQRLAALFERSNLECVSVGEDDYNLASWAYEQKMREPLVHVIPRALGESLRLNDEQIVFLRDEDFFGRKQRKRDYKAKGTIVERTHTLSFGDLNPGDAVVHVLHGIGTYEGLKVMPIGGIDAEFITLGYKDGDKLYLPIYRINQIQKYSGPAGQKLIDKLGGTQWQKVKGRVRNHLREIASDLLELYAKRSQIHRPPFPANDDDFSKFEATFPYDETEDQLKAVNDIVGDMTSDKPMDRLVCGDVGFGKTEVAMRAAFKAVEGRRQVAVL